MKKETVSIEVSESTLKSLDYFSKKWRDACTGEATDYNTIIGIMMQDFMVKPVTVELTDSTVKALAELAEKYPPSITQGELVNYLIQVAWCKTL